ncbi:carbonic anhydrase [Pantoea septica]|uniref:carbonic anhydrase n=1 Tax=Pantoea septica TaxID=472695 RepID=UPI0023F13F30|nr:carbonic anhydrase family protein [Pantoea septica]
MKRTRLAALLMALSAIGAACASTPHWSYEGKAGPAHWGELAADYQTCHNGQFQSPIDIKNAIDGKLPPLGLEFHTSVETLVNNGHTIQVSVDDEDDFRLDGEIFQLKQYHFHTPSENQIEGRSFPLEAHFVHSNAAGELAVVAVMFEVGKKNPALNPILAVIPTQLNYPVAVDKRVDLRPLFPDDLHYYRFSGSLTTPPCSEGLRWLVMKQPVTLSQAQLDAFRQALKSSNNRPLQPLHGRLIVK